MKMILACLLLAASVWSQPAPKFEVASVKLHPVPANVFFVARTGGGSGGAISLAGNRVTITGTLSILVMAAYNLKDYQVTSAPDWTDSAGKAEMYDIVAKTEGDGTPTTEQVRLALQALLADRFHLKVHSGSKEVPVYSLTVDKNGPKMKESAPGTEHKVDMLQASGTIFRVRFTNCTMPELARQLASSFDRPLNDDTGLKSGYDFTLEYTPRRPDGSLMPGQEALEAAETAPTIMPALQQELGLKVAPAKEHVETLVIDHAERPSAN